MVLSTKTLIMIAMNNPPLHFLFLQSHLPLYLDDVALAIRRRRRLWMNHDEAPPHATREVTALLNEHFADRWLRRGGLVPWPPRSPDLSSCGAAWNPRCTWMESQTHDSLMQRINEAAVSMQWIQSLEVHFVACVQARGGYFVQYMWKWC
jgi:hypothetical protein